MEKSNKTFQALYVEVLSTDTPVSKTLASPPQISAWILHAIHKP